MRSRAGCRSASCSTSEAERAVVLTTDRHLVFDWALLAAPWSAAAYGDAIWLREKMFGDERWLADVLSNHDQARQATRLADSAGIADTDAVARAAAVVLLTLRGTPFLYYGEEIGLGDVAIPVDEIIDPPARRALVDPDFEWWNRDQCRTPMPWTAEAGHGFTTGRPWLRFGDDAADRNVATRDERPGFRAVDLPAADRPQAFERGAPVGHAPPGPDRVTGRPGVAPGGPRRALAGRRQLRR